MQALPDADAAGSLAQVELHNGEDLVLERADDLGPDNVGVLIFTERRKPSMSHGATLPASTR